MQDYIVDKPFEETVAAIFARHKLNARHEKFVSEYIIDNNGTQAAIRAGYAKKSAHVQAFRLLRNDKVAIAVSQIKTAKAMSLGFGKEDLIAYRIETIRNSSLSQAVRDRAAVALERIWGLYKHEMDVTLTGNLAERLAQARKRIAPTMTT